MADNKERKTSLKVEAWLERWHCQATGSNTNEASKGHRTLEDSGGRQLPAMEGRSLEQDRTE